MEPDIKLFLVEIGGIVRLLFSGGRFAVVQDAKTFSELPFK